MDAQFVACYQHSITRFEGSSVLAMYPATGMWWCGLLILALGAVKCISE